MNDVFQSTHPHGVRQPHHSAVRLSKSFQSTHPHGVRRQLGAVHILDSYRFNPRTHTGCDVMCKPFQTGKAFQSTHPHGVRRQTRRLFPRLFCFNPRTHTGCDPTTSSTAGATASFNPRTHTGCDTIMVRPLQPWLVSIHAPTRGATLPERWAWTLTRCFNPRTHTGCDCKAYPAYRKADGFNPRTHTGCD